MDEKYAMNKLILTLMLAVVSSSAMAEWIFSAEDHNSKYYINPDSIRKSGNTVQMWELANFNEVQKMRNGEKYLSYKNQTEFKCEARQRRSTYTVLYSEHMGEGNTVHTFDVPDKWSPAVPESVGETHLEIASGK